MGSLDTDNLDCPIAADFDHSMKLEHKSRPRGIALIIVLIVIVVLGILAGGFAYSMKVETKLARNASLDAELEWLGRSGVDLARYVLAVESTGPLGPIDSRMNKWAGGPGVPATGPGAPVGGPGALAGGPDAPNSPLANMNLDHYQMSEDDSRWVAVKIVDNDRKFNINVAERAVLVEALRLITGEVAENAEGHREVADSILDWRDPNDMTGDFGAESDFYETLQPPYVAKNGPIDDLSELLLVRGISGPMFWGAGAGGHMQVLNRPSAARRSRFEEPIYTIGLNDLFTPLSSRLVNINTADANVLQLIPVVDGNRYIFPIDENVARDIISGLGVGRAGPDGADGTEDDMPFRSPGEIGRIPSLAPVAGQISRFCTVRSLVFEVTVDAHIGNYHRKYVATLRRNGPRDIQVLSFYWKAS
jgi:general secretion pathway protein K